MDIEFGVMKCNMHTGASHAPGQVQDGSCHKDEENSYILLTSVYVVQY